MLIIAIDRGRILSLEWVEGYLWVGLGDGSIVSFFFFHFRFMLCIYRCSLSLSLSLSLPVGVGFDKRLGCHKGLARS